MTKFVSTRKHLVVLAFGLACAGVLLLWVNSSTAQEGHGAAKLGTGAESPTGEGACAPIMSVLTNEVSQNEFARAGLRSDRVAATAIGEWEVGSLTCLDSGTEGRVRAAIVELVDEGGETAAFWLLAHEEESDMDEWRRYLTDIASPDWTPAAFESVGSALVALRHSSDQARWKPSDADLGSSMWQTVQTAAQDR